MFRAADKDQRIKKEGKCVTHERKRDTPSKINLWLTTLVLSFTKQIKIGDRHDYDTYKKIHPVTPKQVVNVFDLGYLGVEKVFPEQMASLPNKKKR